MTSEIPNYEELAALHALGLLDAEATRQLLDAAGRDPELRRLVHALDETAVQLALGAPVVSPPPDLRRQILAALPADHGKIRSLSPWFPYALAACLAGLALVQGVALLDLRTGEVELQAQLERATANLASLRESNALMSLRVIALEAKDPAYAAARVLVAWDRNQHRGTVALANLPAPPTGRDYQLWVLDPTAPSPLSAGVLAVSRTFDSPPVATKNPGFAISLEPAGGSPTRTGPILFAVAPAE